MERNEYITRLFKKYLEGKHSSKELDELLQYFGLSEESQQLESLIIQEIRGAEVTSEDEHVNELAERIRSTLVSKTQPFTGKRLLYIVSTAATLLVATAVGFYIYRNSEPKTVITLAENDVPPGTNKATLTLSNGSTIQLSETEDGIIVGDSIRYNGGETITSFAHTEYATLSTPRAGQYQVTLPDDTKVWLNAESSLGYPTAFTGKERKVTLSGEAYFEVAENKGQPFIVESASQTLTVLGTKFNVSTYDGFPVTTLVSGGVHLSSKKVKAVTLKPNQQATLSATNFEIDEVDAADYVVWKDGLMILNNATPDDVFRYIERWYNVDVLSEEISKNTERAYININRNEKLSSVLEALELTYGLRFTIKGKEVIVKY